jgi:hypothetical protein
LQHNNIQQPIETIRTSLPLLAVKTWLILLPPASHQSSVPALLGALSFGQWEKHDAKNMQNQQNQQAKQMDQQM